MRESALAEARRLGGTRFTLDRMLVLALLRSANGDPKGKARAKGLLAVSMRAAMEEDIEKAKSIFRELLGR
jgi:hypothetical protein